MATNRSFANMLNQDVKSVSKKPKKSTWHKMAEEEQKKKDLKKK